MRRREQAATRILFLATALLSSSCGQDERAPLVDLSGEAGRPAIPTRTTQPDASDTDASMDASGSDGSFLDANADATDSSFDAASAFYCIGVSGGDRSNNMDGVEVSSQTPLAFETNFAFAQWDRICDPPRLNIGLAEDSCIFDIGKQLVFRLNEEAIGTMLMPGGNQIEVAQFEDRIEVWYRVPDPDGPAARWGNCEGSFGSILFEDIGSRTGDRIVAEFDLTLTDCATPQQRLPIRIQGNIDVTVPDYGRVCR